MKALQHRAELDATILMYRKPLHLPALPESPPIREGRLGLTVVAREVPPQRPVPRQWGVAKQWFQCLALQRQVGRCRRLNYDSQSCNCRVVRPRTQFLRETLPHCFRCVLLSICDADERGSDLLASHFAETTASSPQECSTGLPPQRVRPLSASFHLNAEHAAVGGSSERFDLDQDITPNPWGWLDQIHDRILQAGALTLHVFDCLNRVRDRIFLSDANP